MQTIQEKAFDYIDTHKEEMLTLLQELVSIESTSDNIDGVNRAIEVLREKFVQAGITAETFDFKTAGKTLVGEWKEDQAVNNLIVLIGHCDTVFLKGVLREMPLRCDGENIYGPGALDMKGGLVIGLYVIMALQAAEMNDLAFKFIVSGDEETGHEHSFSNSIITDQVQGALAAFTLETGYLDNKIIIQRKGVGRFTIECFGRAAHAGICPEKGCHAILEAAHKVIEIQKLNNNSDGTLYNVGVICGGMVANSVPDKCKITIDIRYANVNLTDDIRERLQKIADTAYVTGTKSTMQGGFSFIPMAPTEQNLWLFNIIKQSAKELQEPVPYIGATGGGSDATWPSACGIPTVCSMGIQGCHNHTPKEYAQIDSLYRRSKLLISSIIKIREECVAGKKTAM